MSNLPVGIAAPRRRAWVAVPEVLARCITAITGQADSERCRLRLSASAQKWVDAALQRGLLRSVYPLPEGLDAYSLERVVVPDNVIEELALFPGTTAIIYTGRPDTGLTRGDVIALVIPGTPDHCLEFVGRIDSFICGIMSLRYLNSIQ